MTQVYDTIAHDAYDKLIKGSPLTNPRIRDYFNACFQNSIDHFGAYQCWSCVACLKAGNSQQGWGEPPSTCPTCHSKSVYEIATFQGRSPIVGSAFATGFQYLMLAYFGVPLTPTPGNTRTHDFEATSEIAIEAKGSPSTVTNPNGSITHLDRPGMERSDTRKKAFDNANTYRQRGNKGLFFVVSNAIPSDLVGYRNGNVSALFDVNKADRLKALVTEIGGKIDLPKLRASKGVTTFEATA